MVHTHVRRRRKFARQPTTPQQTSTPKKSPGPTPTPVMPEAWFRARFPTAFSAAEEQAFAERDGELVGFASEYLIARCIGRAGSPSAPVVFCPEEAEFYRYASGSGLYEPIRRQDVRSEVVKLIEQCSAGSLQHFRAEILKLRTRKVLAPVADALMTESVMRVSEFEPDYHVIPVENGMLDLRTLRLDPFSPQRPVRSKLPIRWDEHAAPPTKFLEYVESMFPAEEDRRLLIDSLAMAFLGNPFQRIVVILGPGGAGKTTLVKLLISLIGIDDTAQFIPKKSDRPFEPVSWIGKKLLYVTEARENSLLGCSQQLKEISGQDTMTVEFKSSNIRMSFTPRSLLMVTGNPDLRLRIEQDRDAWERRLILLRVVKPQNLDPIPDFDQHLMRTEGPGILKVVVEAAQRLLRDGLPKLSEEQDRRVKHLLDASDPYAEFVSVHVEDQVESCVYTADAYAAAKEFLSRNEYRVPGSGELQKRVTRAMEEAGYTTSNSLKKCPDKSTRGWRRIRLRTPSEVPGY